MAAIMPVKLASTVANVLEVCFAIFLAELIANTLCNGPDEFEGFLLCRQCGLEITRADNLRNIPSPLASRQRNDTLSGSKGVLIQLFKNPEGKYFEVISTSEAEVQRVHKPVLKDTWFPGFTWTVAVCPRCGQHLGWAFDPVASPEGDRVVTINQVPYADRFVGLILGHLLHEQEAESIIAVPKTYHS